jgi:hypothetical protein
VTAISSARRLTNSKRLKETGLRLGP